MKKFKNSVISILALLLLIGCSASIEADYELAYTTRAAVAVTNNMNSSAISFQIANAEYSEDDGTKKVILECIYRFEGGRLETYVFAVGEGGEPFESALLHKRGVIDEETGLCVINNGDKPYIKNENNKIDLRKLSQNHKKYTSSKDPKVLGISETGVPYAGVIPEVDSDTTLPPNPDEDAAAEQIAKILESETEGAT